MISQYEPNIETIERERIILQHIKDCPQSHHNALIKLIVPTYMAKTTFEKTRDSLLEKNIITVRTQGNMKFYNVVPDHELKILRNYEKVTNTSFHNIKTTIKKLETDFSHKDIDEKISFTNSLIRNLLQIDTGFTLLDSIKNPKKTLYKDEHLEVQQLLFHVFEFIHNDKDYEIISPSIMGSIGNFISNDFLEV